MSSAITHEGDLVSYGEIVLFGDSITEQSFNPEWFGSGSALANTYARRLDVKNRGFSGYTTIQALNLLPRIFPRRDDNVKLVVIFFGANDATLPGEIQHVPLQQYLDNFEKLLTSDALRGKVIAVTPPPIDEYTHQVDFGLTRTVEATHEYGAALKVLCDRLKVPVADVWTSYMTAIGWDSNDTSPLPGSLKVPKNEKLSAFFRDGLHPVGSGYRLIYDTIQTTINNQFPHLHPETTRYHTPYWQQAVYPKAGQLIRWRIDTTKWSENDFEERMKQVPEIDAVNIKKFHFAKDQYMALGSVLLQRQFINQVLGQPMSQIGHVTRDENNRPIYRNSAVRAHDYNVSHHAGIVVLAAVLDSGRVGVDITVPEVLQAPETAASYLSSFEDCFSKLEWQQIGTSLQKFAQHWALKEAYVKAIGTGIVADLPSIEFRDIQYVDEKQSMQSSAATLFVHGNRESWHFELQFLDGKYIAIATQYENTTIESFEDVP